MCLHNSPYATIHLKLCALAILIILSSCQGGSESQVTASHYTQCDVSAEDTVFTPDSILISGNMRIETLGSLFIRIENRSTHGILLGDTAYIDGDTPPRKLLDVPLSGLCDPLVRHGERKELCVDLSLRETQYSSDTPYSFCASYTVGGERFPLTYNFQTPTLWRDRHGMLSLQLDTIIDQPLVIP